MGDGETDVDELGDVGGDAVGLADGEGEGLAGDEVDAAPLQAARVMASETRWTLRMARLVPDRFRIAVPLPFGHTNPMSEVVSTQTFRPPFCHGRAQLKALPRS